MLWTDQFDVDSPLVDQFDVDSPAWFRNLNKLIVLKSVFFLNEVLFWGSGRNNNIKKNNNNNNFPPAG